jgi:hypothetical protein
MAGQGQLSPGEAGETTGWGQLPLGPQWGPSVPGLQPQTLQVLDRQEALLPIPQASSQTSARDPARKEGSQ